MKPATERTLNLRKSNVCFMTLILLSFQVNAELLYITEANNLRRLDTSTIASGNIQSEIFVQHAEKQIINNQKRSVHSGTNP